MISNGWWYYHQPDSGWSMIHMLEPLRTSSLKHVFIERFEELIISGKITRGQKLPSERALALQLGVSRPVVHEGLVELAARGLVTLRPRVGAVVSDYRRQGSLAVLDSLLSYRRGTVDWVLLDGLLSLRRLVEAETARLAAHNRTDDDLKELGQILDREGKVRESHVDALVNVDFDFHHGVALASGNPIYPMFLKSFEPASKSLAAQFFGVDAVASTVFGFHRELVEAIDSRDENRARAVMVELLCHGRSVLREALHVSVEERDDD